MDFRIFVLLALGVIRVMPQRMALQTIQISDTRTYHSLRRSVGANMALNGIPATAYTAVVSFGTPMQNFSLVVSIRSPRDNCNPFCFTILFYFIRKKKSLFLLS